MPKKKKTNKYEELAKEKGDSIYDPGDFETLTKVKKEKPSPKNKTTVEKQSTENLKNLCDGILNMINRSLPVGSRKDALKIISHGNKISEINIDFIDLKASVASITEHANKCLVTRDKFIINRELINIKNIIENILKEVNNYDK